MWTIFATLQVLDQSILIETAEVGDEYRVKMNGGGELPDGGEVAYFDAADSALDYAAAVGATLTAEYDSMDCETAYYPDRSIRV